MGGCKDGPTNDLPPYPNDYGSIGGGKDGPIECDDSNDYGTICGGRDGPIDGEPNYYEPIGGGANGPTNDEGDEHDQSPCGHDPTIHGIRSYGDEHGDGIDCGNDGPIDGESDGHCFGQSLNA